MKKTFFIINKFLVLFILLMVCDVFATPSFQEVKDSYFASDAFLLDRNGKIVHELRVNPDIRRFEWISLKDISPALIKAVIQSEDKRFYSHYGVDWVSVISTLIKNFTGKNRRGASTITMQVAALINEELKPGINGRSVSQKWRQVKEALEIEKIWSKDEILEAYLNLVSYRGELQGIAAASRCLFNKEPSGLNSAESIILAALIRSPNAEIDKIIKRANLLNKTFNFVVKPEEIEDTIKKTFNRKYYVRQKENLAPHVAHLLLNRTGNNINPVYYGAKSIFTTLDYDIQRFVSETLKEHISSLKSRNVNDGAAIVVENKSGDILAYTGSIGDGSDAPYVDGVRAKRQAGSTLKPFLYALAIDKHLLTAASVITDSPFDISTEYGIYKPQNYENDFKGLVTLRTALASSLNVPAVRTLSLIGVDNFVRKLKESGFDNIRNADYYGHSLALGSADVTLYELVNAYRMLANGGIYTNLKLKKENSLYQQTKVFSPEAAFIISDILSDREARGYTFSLENPLNTKFRSSVKTGTSKDMRDNWCIGYTDKYTVGVWVGNFSGEAMWNVTGITGAAPVWLSIMNYLHRDNIDTGIEHPDGIVKKPVFINSTNPTERDEWFIKGTEPSTTRNSRYIISLNEEHFIPHIVYPPDGTIITLDPDIPDEIQKIIIETNPPSDEIFWIFDGKNTGRTTKTPLIIKPVAGKHTIQLIDKQNSKLDSIEFEIKGNSKIN
ncbi:MAG: penicillin-binding protein 1C [Nitrospirae bacterium]|nr:penicillin-binding protein 1C [Nitrospirota bacterium]